MNLSNSAKIQIDQVNFLYLGEVELIDSVILMHLSLTCSLHITGKRTRAIVIHNYILGK